MERQAPVKKMPTGEKQARYWDFPMGPIKVPPGQKVKIDIQPKCEFRVERLVPPSQNEGIHLTGLYIGQKEILNLNGDSIEMNRVVEIKTKERSEPARTVEVHIENRDKVERVVHFQLMGHAFL